MGKIYGNAISLGQTIGFTQNAPLEDRVAVENAADLANLKAYQGLITYVYSEDKYYSYRQGQWHQGLPGQSSHEDETPHRFMTKQAYMNLEEIDPNVLYCLYEDSEQKVQIPIPLDYTIGMRNLPYTVYDTQGYFIVGNNTIPEYVDTHQRFEAQLKNPYETEWADGTVSNKYFSISITKPEPEPEPTDWVFGDNFPIIFGTSN